MPTAASAIHVRPHADIACRLSSGLTEEDFIGESVREPLCGCLHKVAAALSALPVDGQMVKDALEFKAAADSLKVSLIFETCSASSVWLMWWCSVVC
jgi:hypothetical protein